MPAAVWIPIAMSAAGTAYGMYSQHKAQSEASAAAQRAEKQFNDQYGENSAIGRDQRGVAKQLLGVGLPAAGRTAGYYSTLLGGDRAAMRAATAGPRGAIEDTYRGAARGIERSGLRGGSRDQALAELAREGAGKVAGLTSGVQPMAAEGLGNLAGSLIGQGGANLGNSALTGQSLLSQAGSMFGTQTQNKWNQYAAGQQQIQQWGALLAQLLEAQRRNTGAGAGRRPPVTLDFRTGYEAAKPPPTSPTAYIDY